MDEKRSAVVVPGRLGAELVAAFAARGEIGKSPNIPLRTGFWCFWADSTPRLSGPKVT